MKTAILLAALLTPLSALALSDQPDRSVQPVQPGPPDLANARAKERAEPVITVTGSGLIERAPDYAVIHVGVYARESSAANASAKAGELMKKVSEAVKALKLEGMQLQTSEVSLNPAYVWRNDNNEQRQELVGYDASTTLRVRVTKPSSVGDVLDAAINAGANRIHGVSFELKDALNARQEALGLAATSAREKAEVLARALGMRIIGPINVTAGNDAAPPWQPMANVASFSRGAPEAGMGDTIEPGTVSVRAEATVTFAAMWAR